MYQGARGDWYFGSLTGYCGCAHRVGEPFSVIPLSLCPSAPWFLFIGGLYKFAVNPPKPFDGGFIETTYTSLIPQR